MTTGYVIKADIHAAPSNTQGLMRARFFRAAGLTGMLCAFALLGSGCAELPSEETTLSPSRIESLLQDPVRTQADREADPRRKPSEFLQFSQISEGMRVIDMMAGAGYTSQLLALAVGPSGHVYAQTPKISASLEKRLADHPQPSLEIVVSPMDQALREHLAPVDRVTIVFSYHDIAFMPGVDRLKMDRAVYAALKPGGKLILIDHAALKGSGLEAIHTLHRIDEEKVLEDLTSVGFKLDASSDFMRNPLDPRTQAIRSMTQPVDGFALRLIKPN